MRENVLHFFKSWSRISLNYHLSGCGFCLTITTPVYRVASFNRINSS